MAWSCLVREDRENSCWRTKPETQAEQATPRTAHYLLTLRNWSGRACEILLFRFHDVSLLTLVPYHSPCHAGCCLACSTNDDLDSLRELDLLFPVLIAMFSQHTNIQRARRKPMTKTKATPTTTIEKTRTTARVFFSPNRAGTKAHALCPSGQVSALCTEG